MNPLEIYKALESIFDTYIDRRMTELLADKDLSNEYLHTLRGMAKAAREIRGTVRNNLGYDPKTL